MGYIGNIKRINKKTKSILVSPAPPDKKDGILYYHNVVPYVEGPKKFLNHKDRISYSHANGTVTWIGAATPEYIKIAKELKQRYGGMKPKQQKAILKNAMRMIIGKK
jgi:hypothetical protein